MNLDLPTIFVVMITVSATLAVLVGVVSAGNRRDGLFEWAIALSFHALAYLLFTARGAIPDVLSIAAGNASLSATFAMFAEGLYRFHKRAPPRRLIWMPVALVFILFLALLDDLPARLVLGGMIFSVQCVLPLGVILKNRRTTAGRGQYFLAGGLGLVALLFAARIAITLMGSGTSLGFSEVNRVQSVMFILGITCLILIASGMILMGKERSDERNRLLALHDDLTGLDNRRAILRALDQQVALAGRSRQPLTLLMMDIDHFKNVNDTFGHIEGDEVLRMVANSITARLRTQDLVGRFGGEEFLAILPATTAEGGLELAEALRKSVGNSRITAADGRPIQVTISIGVHQVTEATGAGVSDLINAADQALYRAKDKGRNRVEIS